MEYFIVFNFYNEKNINNNKINQPIHEYNLWIMAININNSKAIENEGSIIKLDLFNRI